MSKNNYKYKIGIPNHLHIEPLVKNESAANEFGFELIKLPETEIRRLMLKNSLHAALLDPIGYGLGVNKADFRILKGPALWAEGYTGIGSIYFKKGLDTFNKIAAEKPDDYLIKIGLLLLAENYDLHPKIVKFENDGGNAAEGHDALISYSFFDDIDGRLDITDDWHLFSELSLPLAFWTVREEEMPEKLLEVIEALVDSTHPKEKTITEKIPFDPEKPRSGKIHYRWNDDLENSLVQIMQFLYFHQITLEIAGIKIHGRD